MADVGALLASGQPPLGLGSFVRDRIETGNQYRFYVLNGAHRDIAEHARIARARGAELWVYFQPQYWRPDAWRETRERCRALVRELGAVGYIANLESGWPRMSRAERDAEIGSFGEAMRGDADDMRVGVVTFPGWPGLATLGRVLGERAFLVVEIYGVHAFDKTTFARWLEQGRAAFGIARTIIAIAAWPARDAMRTASGYAEYLSMLPEAPGAIAWDLAGGDIPDYITAALRGYEPGGSAAGTAAWATLAALGRPVALIVLGVSVAAIVALILAVRYA